MGPSTIRTKKKQLSCLFLVASSLLAHAAAALSSPNLRPPARDLQTEYSIPSILSYQPVFADSLLKIDLDQSTLQGRLALASPEGLQQAKAVYELGAYAQPYAWLQITQSSSTTSSTPLENGTPVQGKSASGTIVRGEIVDTADSNTAIQVAVQYAPETDCAVGGNPTPSTAECEYCIIV